MTKTCNDCIFWEQHSQTKIGFCHCRPPRPVLDEKGNQKIQIIKNTDSELAGVCTALAIDDWGKNVALGYDNGVMVVPSEIFDEDKNVNCWGKKPDDAKKIERYSAQFYLSCADMKATSLLLNLKFTDDKNPDLKISDKTQKIPRDKRVTALALHYKRNELLVGFQHGQIIQVLFESVSSEFSTSEIKPAVAKEKHTIEVSMQQDQERLYNVLTPVGHEITHLKMNEEKGMVAPENMFDSVSANGDLRIWSYQKERAQKSLWS